MVERQPKVERQPAAGWERSEKSRKKLFFRGAKGPVCAIIDGKNGIGTPGGGPAAARLPEERKGETA